MAGDSTLIRVADHDGQSLVDRGIMTQTESVFIQPQTLDDALDTIAGRVLLRILKAVDYAGAQHRPVMLLGRRQDKGGMVLHLTVPHPDRPHLAPPELNGQGSVKQNGSRPASKRGTKFYAS